MLNNHIDRLEDIICLSLCRDCSLAEENSFSLEPGSQPLTKFTHSAFL